MDMTVVEQRYRAVLAVEQGEPRYQVAAQFGVSRQTLHTWIARYRADGLAGLASRSRRPDACPHQASEAVEVAVCEMRRGNPRWGPRRIAHELGFRFGEQAPSRSTVARILHRNGLVEPRRRRKLRSDYRRWERPEPMQLWQLDIVGGIHVRSPDGTVTEAKIVTGVDDHSRFAVIATVMVRATGRAVCLAFAEALRRYGIPDEVLTDNGKQFTARFGRGGEVLFDRICRDNAITHRLTQPATPTTTGKVERFHQTLRRELLDHAEPFDSLLAAQAALDSWISDYNCARPHQAIEMACPVDRFAPSQHQRGDEELLPLRLPARLTTAPAPGDETGPDPADEPTTEVEAYRGGPVEFERVVPASGNLAVLGKQFWLGPHRAGITVTFWADNQVIHLTAGRARIKTVRSPYTDNQLATLAATGGRPAGPSPLPPVEPDGTAIEVDRTVSRQGLISVGGCWNLAAEILGGRRVTIRIDDHVLLIFDPDTRELLRTRPNPLTYDQARHLRGARPAGPPPRPSVEPVTVTRRVSATGTIMIARQLIALGREQARTVVTAHVAEHTITVDLIDGAQRTYSRTTTGAIRNLKAQTDRTVS
ncbi:IS481 family transposase [Pseudonocardia nantongensis]|uniref:IS481 family transposase n=1 Tax=Pseudonocardia nantongensis TaxID=1181885 RepID=UPI00397A1067